MGARVLRQAQERRLTWNGESMTCIVGIEHDGIVHLGGDSLSGNGYTSDSIAEAKVHLKTQDNQPYGSERRCCEECGVMLWGLPDDPPWTSHRHVYNDEPKGYINCRTWNQVARTV